MVSIIIYAADVKYTTKTIDSLLDCTNPDLISEIIVCDDLNLQFVYDGVRHVNSNGIGRARAFAMAAVAANGDYLVFCKGRVKFSPNWLDGLLETIDSAPMAMVSPTTYVLDLVSWSCENSRMKRIGWRWNSTIYDKQGIDSNLTPTVLSNCFMIRRQHYEWLGGFDDGMGFGAGEDVELSLRNWLFGGACLVADASRVAVPHEIDTNKSTINNFARIVEMWLPTYANCFYNINNVDQALINLGRLSNLTAKAVRDASWFIDNLQPELGAIYKLRGAASGKSVAIVGVGPSLDMIPSSLIQNHDIIIGVEFAALLFKCDYIMVNTVHAATELRGQYQGNRFVVPPLLSNMSAGRWELTANVLDGAIRYELGSLGVVPVSAEQPFCNFDDILITAVHFALFMCPQRITIFGYDNKIVNGKSHTSRVEFYNNGEMWNESEATKRRFAYSEFAIDRLGKLADELKVPILRVNHA